MGNIHPISLFLPDFATEPPLPQSTADEYIRLRPEDFKMNPFTPEQYDRQEVIGPCRVETASCGSVLHSRGDHG